MKDNSNQQCNLFEIVVNCFQKLLSSWWRTTEAYKIIWQLQLWIAFKNYYLRDEGQPKEILNSLPEGCELLSKIIIFVMKDNASTSLLLASIVVNCFQKLLSSWWRTTKLIKTLMYQMLWIAFKNYYLRDEGQQDFVNIINAGCCELLSKIIIFVMKDNHLS